MPIRREESRAKKLLFTALIGFVLLTSIIGFSYSAISFQLSSNRQNSIEFNGVEFFATDIGIATQFDGQIYEFTYYPDELAAVDTAEVTSAVMDSRMAYVTSHPNSSIASQITGLQFDMSRALEGRRNSFIEAAFTAENPYNMSVVTCGDATLAVPVIFVNFTNTTTAVERVGNCITVNVGSESSFSRVRDKMIYEILGVLP